MAYIDKSVIHVRGFTSLWEVKWISAISRQHSNLVMVAENTPRFFSDLATSIPKLTPKLYLIEGDILKRFDVMTSNKQNLYELSTSSTEQRAELQHGYVFYKKQWLSMLYGVKANKLFAFSLNNSRLQWLKVFDDCVFTNPIVCRMSSKQWVVLMLMQQLMPVKKNKLLILDAIDGHIVTSFDLPVDNALIEFSIVAIDSQSKGEVDQIYIANGTRTWKLNTSLANRYTWHLQALPIVKVQGDWQALRPVITRGLTADLLLTNAYISKKHRLSKIIQFKLSDNLLIPTLTEYSQQKTWEYYTTGIISEPTVRNTNMIFSVEDGRSVDIRVLDLITGKYKNGCSAYIHDTLDAIEYPLSLNVLIFENLNQPQKIFTRTLSGYLAECELQVDLPNLGRKTWMQALKH